MLNSLHTWNKFRGYTRALSHSVYSVEQAYCLFLRTPDRDWIILKIWKTGEKGIPTQDKRDWYRPFDIIRKGNLNPSPPSQKVGPLILWVGPIHWLAGCSPQTEKCSGKTKQIFYPLARNLSKSSNILFKCFRFWNFT